MTVRQPGLKTRLALETKRISSQHRQLDALYELVVDAVNHRLGAAARSAFERFHDALDAHLSLEEELYFPALNGMRPELREELDGLCEEHVTLREKLDAIAHVLQEYPLEESVPLLEDMANTIANHEGREELLLSRIRPGG